MALLNPPQTREVAELITTPRLDSQLKEELLDHLCCEVEALLEDDIPFTEALRITSERWSPRRITRLNRRHFLTLKFQPFMLRLATAAAVVAVLWLLFPDRPTSPAIMVPETAPAVLAIATPLAFDPPSGSPIAGMELTSANSGFGMRMHPLKKVKVFHRGIDLVAPTGTDVLSTAAGRVEFAGENGDHGIQVRIRHDDGYTTVYTHLSLAAVTEGEEVDQGTRIGAVGSTGKSTGPHLHYEILKDDRPINPLAMN